MRKTVIVMAYYDRAFQLNKTLDSLRTSKHNNFSVVVVDDCSPEDYNIPKNLNYEVEIIKLKNKTWTNCAPVYNFGFHRALQMGAEVILIQSAECFHVGDILSHSHNNVSDVNYVAYGCFSLDRYTTFNSRNIEPLALKTKTRVNSDSKLGQNGWWNHSTIFPLPQYWCAGLTRNNLIKINGIDERFAMGHAFEDGWFVKQVENMGLRIDIVNQPFVAHQWHERNVPEDPSYYNRNKELYLRLMQTKEFRSEHSITPDL